MSAGLLQLLLENLIAMTPPMPPADAMCHRNLVPQSKCGRCSRIAAAMAAIELAQLNGHADTERDERLAKRRAARARKKAPRVLDDDHERATLEALAAAAKKVVGGA